MQAGLDGLQPLLECRHAAIEMVQPRAKQGEDCRRPGRGVTAQKWAGCLPAVTFGIVT